ncbi:ABC transporter family protein, partial [Vibrio parahaemolyticus V-223/04]
RCL